MGVYRSWSFDSGIWELARILAAQQVTLLLARIQNHSNHSLKLMPRIGPESDISKRKLSLS